MTITVLDENDNTPTFERSYFNLTFEEDEEVRGAWNGVHAPEERERGREEMVYNESDMGRACGGFP